MGKITEALKKAASERVHRIEKVNRIATHKPLVARRMGDSRVDPRIVAYHDPKAVITEQYKRLRTNFLSLNKAKPPKVAMISSSIHSEGKSITALNLGIVLAQAVHKPKVLVIDADMRKGKLHRYLGVEAAFGLSDVLTGRMAVDEVLFQIDIDNLYFLAAGPVADNPAELLGSHEMEKLLARLRTEFDHILIDTPPVIQVTDASVLGPMTEGVIMVVQAGRTQRGMVDRAAELFHQAHTRILGYVLTNIEYHLPEYVYRYL